MPSYDSGTVEARLTLDRSQFTASINAARAQAKSLEGKEIRIKVDVDKGKLDATVANVKRKLQDVDRTKVEPKITIDRGGLATRRISLLKTALIGLAPAGIPILAGLTAATLGLSGAFAAAGAGMGVFGLAAGGAIAQAAEASKEITKLEDSLEDTDDIAKRADIYGKLDKVWQGMDSHTKEFVQTLRGTKSVWDQFLAATRPTTLTLASDALKQIGPALAPLPGVVDKFAPVFQSWLSGITNFIRGPGYAGFISFISQEGPPALENLGRLVVNLGTGVSSLVRTFTPFGQEFLFTLTKGSETFREWARDLGGTSGFQAFMDYIQQTGPQVVEALGSLAGAVVSITVALAPLGGPTLEVISAIATGLGAIADVAPGLIQFALIAGTVARGIGAISDAQVAIGRRTDRFKAVFADAVGPVNKLKAGLGGALGLIGGPWGLALAAGTVALGYFATKHAEGQQRIADFTAALQEEQGALAGTVKQQAAMRLEQEGALKSAQKLGISSQDVTRAVLDQDGSLKGLLARLHEIAEANKSVDETSGLEVYNNEGRAALNLSRALEGVNGELGKGLEAYNRTADAAGEVIKSQDGIAFATKNAADNYDKQRRSIEETIAAQQALIDKTREARNQALGYRNAQVGLEQAFDDAADALKENGKTLDINTQKGRDNREALHGIAASINEVVDSEKFRAASAPGQIKILEDQRDRFIDIAVAMGASKDAAKAMADELIKTPKEITTEHKIKTDQAALDKLKKDAEAAAKPIETKAKFVTDDKNVAAYQKALGGIPPEKPTQAKFATDDANVAAYLGALGTIPPEKPTKAKFATDNENVASYLAALGTLPPNVPTTGTFAPETSKVQGWGGLLDAVPNSTNTDGKYNPNLPAVQQWKRDLDTVPGSTTTRGHFNADIGAVQSYLGYLNSIDGKNVTAYARTVRRVETIYERRTGNLPAHGGIQGPGGEFAYSYAKGGVVPGYAPDHDSWPAMLSPGEGILRPEVVRALGEETIHAWNRSAGKMTGPDLQIRMQRPQRHLTIENYHSYSTAPSEKDALMDTAQDFNLMFGDMR